MAPGMLLFHDPRLYEKFGSTLLHLGTLLGVFLLARRSFGMRCAYLSVIPLRCVWTRPLLRWLSLPHWAPLLLHLAGLFRRPMGNL